MYRSFEVIYDFIRDIYGCSFLKSPMDEKISQISELAKAHLTVRSTIEQARPPFSAEFMENVFPILEVAVQWDELRKSDRIEEGFLEKCKKRMGPPSGIFRGTIFETDMATRCLLSDWKVDFPEDYTKKGKQLDLLITKPSGEVIGLECESKRGTGHINIERVNENVQNKSVKFKPDYLKLLESRLSVRLDKRILILDVTREEYNTPEILGNLNQIEISTGLDGVVLTWREDLIEDVNHSLRIKYKALGNIPDKYFSTTWAAEFRGGNRPVFFLRKYVEPEPKHGRWGPEETYESHVEKDD